MIHPHPVSFGNPALGVYHGTVYTLSTDTAKDESSSSHSASTLSSNNGELLPDLQKLRCMVAMTQVPPEQVPEGVLNLARAHRPWIQRVRIVIAEEEKSSEPPSEPSRTYLVLLELSDEEAAHVLVEDLHQKPYTLLDETQLCHVYPVVALQGQDGVSLLSPFFAPNAHSATEANLEILQHPSEDYHCAVCLEHMELDTSRHDEEKVPILTTVCNHSFHIDCLIKWQDSPCPVCRYDHSGLNEALSQCHQCGTTDNNYVCLICGVVSCGGERRTYIPAAASASSCRTEDEDENLLRSQQRMLTSHARKHYDETLHAYALDTVTQHVWDFAGQGYVHRLLQNKEDGKLVEISDPNNTSSQERSPHPEMSDAQEGEMVHRKLEGFASQYYTLLKSQLEQQRIFYEGRLKEIRHEYSRKPRHSTDLVLALKQERQQLSQRLNSVQDRFHKVHDSVKFLRHMNESLEANKEPLQKQIEHAQQEQVEIRKRFETVLPPLQEKVTRLMLQLERENCTDHSQQPSRPK